MLSLHLVLTIAIPCWLGRLSLLPTGFSNTTAWVIIGKQQFDRGLSRLLHSKLLGLDIPQCVQYKLGVTIYLCLQNRALCSEVWVLCRQPQQENADGVYCKCLLGKVGVKSRFIRPFFDVMLGSASLWRGVQTPPNSRCYSVILFQMENMLKTQSGKVAMDQSAVEAALLDWCRKTTAGYCSLLTDLA